MDLTIVMGGMPDPGDPRWRRELEAKLSGEREVLQAKARESGMAFVDLDRVRPNADARAALPPDLAREIGTLPLKLDGKTLWCALVDPTDGGAIRRAQEASRCRVIPMVALPRAIEAALARL